jgi:hypothetical protein
MQRSRTWIGALGALVLLCAPVCAVKPPDAQAEVLLGETCYRKADFDGAADHFATALQSNPGVARAHLGLARLDQLRFRLRAARTRIEQAYSLDSEDPEIIRAHATLSQNPAEEIAALKQYLERGAHQSRKDLETAVARIQLLSRLHGRDTAVLTTPYAPYRLKLIPWVPTAGLAAGMLLKVSINGGKPLRLALDTGANGIYVSRKAVENLGLEDLVNAAVTGLGEAPQNSRLALAETVEIGDLAFRDCQIYVTHQPLTSWADGVIGARFFERFILRLDVRRQTLDLSPYAGISPQTVRAESAWTDWEQTPEAKADGDLPFYRVEHFVLVPTVVNRKLPGYFVLDTGAAHTVVDGSIAAAAHATDSLRMLAMAAPGGEIRSAGLTGPLSFQFAGREFTDTEISTFDLGPVSDSCGVRISGLLGYPLLRRSVLRINYRDGFLGVER